MSFLSESVLFYIISAFATLIAIAIAYFKYKLTYWDRIGVPTLDPVLFYGDTKEQLLGRKNFGVMSRELYLKVRARNLKHAGVYFGPSPNYLPVDPELIKHILQKDFVHFMNHGNTVNEKNDPLSAHLFNLEDAKWRNMRVKLTPTFTSGKMKMMFQTLVDCTKGLKEKIEEAAVTKTPVDIKDILARFTTDIIGSVAFGLECNSLKDPDAPFRVYGRRHLEVTRTLIFKLFLKRFLPNFLLDLMKWRFIKPEVEEFFMKVVKDTVAYREKNNVVRKDFMHLLLQLKNLGKVTDDDIIIDENTKTKGLTINELAAQAFLFYVAGFETSSTTMTFALYELAVNPDIQEKVREEVNTILHNHNNELTYNGIMEMTYTDKVLNETLRKYPPVPALPRECSKDYIIPGTKIKLSKGTKLQIPVLGIHHDPEYYPNPEAFDPERFTPENINSRPPCTWIPFGEGPRICIGLRFGLMQSKVGLATILRNYQVTLNQKTISPLRISNKSFITAAEGDVWLDIKKIN